jgi:hypothetical protein
LIDFDQLQEYAIEFSEKKNLENYEDEWFMF